MYNKTIFILLNAFNELKKNAEQDAGAETIQAASGSTWESFTQLVGLLVLLIIVLVAAYFTTKFVGGVKLGQLKNSNFKVIDAYRISSNKVIQIVKIANKYIVLAIDKNTINYITELDEAEEYVREEKKVDKQSFKQTLEKMRNINK